jgi:hypothetical protein
MTPEFIHGLLSNVSSGGRRNMTLQLYEAFILKMGSRMDNSYMIILPPGEATAYSGLDSEWPIQGMSASPIFGFLRGTYRLVGIFFSAMRLADTERRRSVDVAFFHPISAIRKLADDPKGHWTLK